MSLGIFNWVDPRSLRHVYSEDSYEDSYYDMSEEEEPAAEDYFVSASPVTELVDENPHEVEPLRLSSSDCLAPIFLARSGPVAQASPECATDSTEETTPPKPSVEEVQEPEISEHSEYLPKTRKEKHLPSSTTPVIDALVYSALKKQGIRLIRNEPDRVQFKLLDFDRYYTFSNKIMKKTSPTTVVESRIKALHVWFEGYISDGETITTKESHLKKIHHVIHRMELFMKGDVAK